MKKYILYSYEYDYEPERAHYVEGVYDTLQEAQNEKQEWEERKRRYRGNEIISIKEVDIVPRKIYYYWDMFYRYDGEYDPTNLYFLHRKDAEKYLKEWRGDSRDAGVQEIEAWIVAYVDDNDRHCLDAFPLDDSYHIINNGVCTGPL